MARLDKFLKNITMLEFPKYRQTDENDCGATAMHAVLAFYNIDVGKAEVVKVAGTNKEIGTPIEGIRKVAKRWGIKFKEGKFTLETLKEHIKKGWPTLLMIQAWSRQENPDWKKEWDQGHYVIAIGFDDKKIYFEDPISIKRTYLTYAALNTRWHGWDDEGNKIYKWGIVFMNKSGFSFEDMEEME